MVYGQAELPSCQGNGVGKLIMDALVDYLKANTPDKAFGGLYTGAERVELYACFGLSVAEATMFQRVSC